MPCASSACTVLSAGLVLPRTHRHHHRSSIPCPSHRCCAHPPPAALLHPNTLRTPTLVQLPPCAQRRRHSYPHLIHATAVSITRAHARPATVLAAAAFAPLDAALSPISPGQIKSLCGCSSSSGGQTTIFDPSIKEWSDRSHFLGAPSYG
ncbi:hypothetical protein B0H14DRAFT_3507490 [Mycena olivaceomarginata]|nr:hypothetical protein B0H14DRAFT_3507490 [Mycena olivaceomarginata]